MQPYENLFFLKDSEVLLNHTLEEQMVSCCYMM